MSKKRGKRRKARSVDQKALAGEVMAAAREYGYGGNLAYDRVANLITVDDGRVLNLANASAECRGVSAAARKSILRPYARCLAMADRADLSDLRKVGGRLLPHVVPAAIFALAETRRQLTSESGHVYHAFGDAWGVEVVVEEEDYFSSVPQKTLDDWGVSWDTVLDIARANLLARSSLPFRRVQPGLYASMWHDNHDPSRLLLLDLVRRLPVEGVHVAAAPNRDLLVITGSEDADGLTAMASILETELERHPRPWDGRVAQLDGSTWIPFMPPEDHPAYPRLLGLEYDARQAEAQRQQAVLQEAVNRDMGERAPFVASFLRMTTPGTLVPRSLCVWGELAGPSMLPVTDMVALMTKKQFLGIAQWPRLMTVCGDMMRPQGLRPERYIVTGFPTAEQLAAIELMPPQDMAAFADRDRERHAAEDRSVESHSGQPRPTVPASEKPDGPSSES